MQLEELPLDIVKIILEYKQNLEDRIAHVKRTFLLNREFFCVYGPDIPWWTLGWEVDDEIGLD